MWIDRKVRRLRILFARDPHLEPAQILALLPQDDDDVEDRAGGQRDRKQVRRLGAGALGIVTGHDRVAVRRPAHERQPFPDHRSVTSPTRLLRRAVRSVQSKGGSAETACAAARMDLPRTTASIGQKD